MFVFTLGLTETWIHRKTGTVYPVAPGVIAGTYDPAIYAFHNFTLPEVRNDLEALRLRLRSLNPEIKMVLTVSPVPLTATASGSSMCWPQPPDQKPRCAERRGRTAMRHEDVDYVPSFELITNPGRKRCLLQTEPAHSNRGRRLGRDAHDLYR